MRQILDAFLFIKLLPITDSLPRHNLSSSFFPGEPLCCELEGICSRTHAVISSGCKATVQDGPGSPSAASEHQPREGTETSPAAAWPPCNCATLQPCKPAILQPCHPAALPPCSLAVTQLGSLATMPLCSRAALQLCHRPGVQWCSTQEHRCLPTQLGSCRSAPSLVSGHGSSPSLSGSVS